MIRKKSRDVQNITHASTLIRVKTTEPNNLDQKASETVQGSANNIPEIRLA